MTLWAASTTSPIMLWQERYNNLFVGIVGLLTYKVYLLQRCSMKNCTVCDSCHSCHGSVLLHNYKSINVRQLWFTAGCVWLRWLETVVILTESVKVFLKAGTGFKLIDSWLAIIWRVGLLGNVCGVRIALGRTAWPRPPLMTPLQLLIR